MEGMTNSKQCVLRGPNAAQEPSARSRPNAKRSVTFDLPPLLLDDDEGCGTGPNTPMEHPEVAGTDVNSFANNNTLLQAAFATSVGTTLQINATSATPSFVDPAVNADVLHALFTLIQRDARLGSQLPVITFTKRHQHLLDDIRSIGEAHFACCSLRAISRVCCCKARLQWCSLLDHYSSLHSGI
jgi:hypothetical protein